MSRPQVHLPQPAPPRDPMQAEAQHGLLLEASEISLVTASGRALLHGLNMAMAREKVALVGRNGVGKSSLLRVLAGVEAPHRGRVRRTANSLLVPQELENAHGAALGGSRGEQRRRLLAAALAGRPELLLLDEPTQDLDIVGVAWLEDQLRSFAGGLLVVTHHRGLLNQFRKFVVVSEAGGFFFPGSFAALEAKLEQRRLQREKKHLRRLADLDKREQHNARVNRRRRRKKNLGRLHEEGRAPSRAQLNGKKGYAQVSQGKAAKLRDARIEGVRQWARASRRALTVQLPLALTIPELLADDGRDLIHLKEIGLERNGQTLIDDLSFSMGRERVAVTGPNGAGKTSLLQLIAGERKATRGHVQCLGRIASIAQGASNWRSRDSLVTRLMDSASLASTEALAQLLVAHKFPLALAQRPLVTLSAGERMRAALICLFQCQPTAEVLVLDEPSYSLDFVATGALIAALNAWPGGLLIASHDAELLRAIGIQRSIALDGHGGHRIDMRAMPGPELSETLDESANDPERDAPTAIRNSR